MKLVNPIRVYWLDDGDHKEKNWGDIFTPFLLSRLGIIYEWADKDHADVFCVGSLLDRVPENFYGYVLGSGFGYRNARRNLLNAQQPMILRGRLSAERCETACEPVFGDPGLFASHFARPCEKKYKMGVIPHVVDKNLDTVRDFHKNHKEDCYVIDIEEGIREVIDRASECQTIVSSSLHGLVLADSLGIPNAWIKLSNKILGNDFKFHDYYSAYSDEIHYPALSIDEGFSKVRLRDIEPVKNSMDNAFENFRNRLVESGQAYAL